MATGKKGSSAPAGEQKQKKPAYEVHIDKTFDDPSKSLRAVASMTIGDFAVRGIKLFQNENGTFVSMPAIPYLKRGIKDLIDEIVDLLAEDENIAKLYDLWYEKKYEALRTYTSEMPQKIPLSQNKEFKSIKNDIIREAIRMNQSGEQKHESRTDSNTTSHHGSEKKTAPHHQTNSVRVTAVTGLLKNLANTFRDKILGDDAKKLPTIDKRQRREIEEKKNAEITMQ